MTLIVQMLLYASETWTSTKTDLYHLQADLNHLQAFYMRCQRRVSSVCAGSIKSRTLISLVVQAFPTLETSSSSAGTPSLATSPAWTHKLQLM